MSSKFIRGCIALGAVVFCGVANAHPGHGGGLMAGVAHPLFGLDHVLAMVAVGVWAYQLGGRATWLVPASFVGLMALAGGAGMVNIGLPMVEIGIALSVLVLGCLIAFSVRVMLHRQSVLQSWRCSPSFMAMRTVPKCLFWVVHGSTVWVSWCLPQACTA